MNCHNCKTPLENSDIAVEFAAHDKTKLDIIIQCPECGFRLNAFVDEEDMMEIPS